MTMIFDNSASKPVACCPVVRTFLKPFYTVVPENQNIWVISSSVKQQETLSELSGIDQSIIRETESYQSQGSWIVCPTTLCILLNSSTGFKIRVHHVVAEAFPPINSRHHCGW